MTDSKHVLIEWYAYCGAEWEDLKPVFSDLPAGTEPPNLLLPYFHPDETQAGVRLRNWNTGQFHWPTGTRPKGWLYGIHLVKPGETVLVVEGESDVVACNLIGERAVGSPGSSTWHAGSPHVQHLLATAGRLLVWQEPDPGGVQFVRSVLATPGWRDDWLVLEGTAGSEDPRQIVLRKGDIKLTRAMSPKAWLAKHDPFRTYQGAGRWTPKGSKQAPDKRGALHYGDAVITGVVQDIANCAEGERNNVLSAKAWKVKQLASQGKIVIESWEQVAARMVEASTLPKREALTVVRRALGLRT